MHGFQIRAVGAAALALLLSAAPQTPGGAISGVVRDEATGDPLPGAVVTLGPRDHPAASVRSQLTDALGRFVLTGLPPLDAYTIAVRRPGYFAGHYGRGSDATPIALSSGQWFPDADVTLVRHGAIAGRVVDHRGDPVVGAYVRALLRVSVAGHAYLAAGPIGRTDDRGMYRLEGLREGRYLVHVPASQHTVPVAMARELARPLPAAAAGRPSISERTFRLAGDTAVTSAYVPALPDLAGRPSTYPPTFHPSAREPAAASWIDLARGDDRGAVDVVLTAVPAFRFSGRIEAQGQDLGSVVLRLMPAGMEAMGSGSEAASAVVRSDGRFVFLGVPAGDYTLIVNRNPSEYRTGSGSLPPAPLPGDFAIESGGAVAAGPPELRWQTLRYTERVGPNAPPQAPAWFGRMALSVAGADVADVVLPLQQATTVTGRLEWDGDASPADPRVTAQIRITFEPADGDPTLAPARQAARTSPDEFVQPDLLPGRYVIRVSGARVKSISANGSDHTQRPLEISSETPDLVVILTTRSALLTGTASRTAAGGAGPLAVILFPPERDQWSDYGFNPVHIATTMTDANGRFELEMPAGDYLALAVDPGSEGSWKDPAFLDRAAALATPVSLQWDAATTVSLRSRASDDGLDAAGRSGHPGRKSPSGGAHDRCARAGRERANQPDRRRRRRPRPASPSGGRHCPRHEPARRDIDGHR